MATIDQPSYDAIRPELSSGETILWAAQPSPSVTFHKEDAFLIPFSLLWGGFAIFWESMVLFGGSKTGSSPVSWFMALWGIPFVVIGQYLIWGRFITARWKKKRTFYALTNRRVIVVQNGWRRRMASAYVDTVPTIIKEKASNGLGTLRFAQSAPMWANQRSLGAWDGMSVGDVPTFVDISDVETVYRMVSDQRERAADRSQSVL